MRPPVYVMADGNLGAFVDNIPGAVWQPEPDVLWTPPGTKSGLDVLGTVTDVSPVDDATAWLRIQLGKRAAWLDMIRAKVRDAKMALTPQLAKMLGLDFDAEIARLRAAGQTPTIVAVKAIELPDRPTIAGAPVWSKPPMRYVG